MTREEMDQVWTVNGLSYVIRDEWVSSRTLSLTIDWKRACKAFGSNHPIAKNAADKLTQSRDADIANALNIIRDRAKHR